MAKWYPSSLINDIRGKLGNDVYTYYRGTHVIRTYVASPSNPNTSRQQLVRGYFSTVASCWWGLPTHIRNMWEKYASLSAKYKCGTGAFYAHNVRILAAFSCTSWMLTAPPFFPATPHHVEGYDWSFAGASTVRMTWDTPRDPNLWIVPSYRLNWDYSPTYNIYWKQIPVVNSTFGTYDWIHPVPTGTEIFLRLRSMDKQGRVSPITHKIKKVVP